MAGDLDGKVAAVTGAASGIGLASAEAMLAAGARVMLIDRDAAALEALSEKHGAAVTPLVIDLLDAKDCATLMPRVFETTGRLENLHANAGLYVGGDLVEADRAQSTENAEPQRQRRDEERSRCAAADDRTRVGRHYRHELARGSLSDPMGARLRFVEVGHQLLRSDGAATGVQAPGFAWVRSLPARSPARCSRIGRRRS